MFQFLAALVGSWRHKIDRKFTEWSKLKPEERDILNSWYTPHPRVLDEIPGRTLSRIPC